jgi:hypothetical protein
LGACKHEIKFVKLKKHCEKYGNSNTHAYFFWPSQGKMKINFNVFSKQDEFSTALPLSALPLNSYM